MQEVSKDLEIKQFPVSSLYAGLAVTAVLNIAIFLPYLTHCREEVLMLPYFLLWVATLPISLRHGFIAKE